MLDNKDALIKRFNRAIESDQHIITKFKENLDKDAAYALTWSLDAFRAAAQIKVSTMIVDHLVGGGTVEQVKSLLTSRVLSKSMYPAQSTSPTSNLIEQYELAAFASTLSDINNY